MVFAQANEVSNGYVELFQILGQHGIIGIVLSVIAIFGLLCLAVIWALKDIARDSQKFTENVKELASQISAISVKSDVHDRTDQKQDNRLEEHDQRLDNHEVRIVKLEDHDLEGRS